MLEQVQRDGLGGQLAGRVAGEVADQIGDDDDLESWFDRLEWRTGADVSKSGSESTQVSVRLTPDRRQRVLYLRAEKDVYEKINFGFKILFRLGK